MATLTMDTHRIVKRLKDAGFTDTQAETVTDIIAATAGRRIWPTSRPKPISPLCARKSKPTFQRWR